MLGCGIVLGCGVLLWCNWVVVLWCWVVVV